MHAAEWNLFRLDQHEIVPGVRLVPMGNCKSHSLILARGRGLLKRTHDSALMQALSMITLRAPSNLHDSQRAPFSLLS